MFKELKINVFINKSLCLLILVKFVFGLGGLNMGIVIENNFVSLS